MSTILDIRNLYGGYEAGTDVLQGLSLSVEENEVVGIIGLNGSGKSTLGRAIMNLLPHRRADSILYKGKDVSAYATNQLAAMGIACMQQGGVVFSNLSVWENIRMAFGRHPDKGYMAQLAEIVPLLKEPSQKLMRTMSDRLSGGERHALALAMTLANRPQLLILDEPSAGLAPKAVDGMYQALRQVRQQFGTTMLIIEQNVAKAVDFCDRCVMMELGTINHVFGKTENMITEIESIMFNHKFLMK